MKKKNLKNENALENLLSYKNMILFPVVKI